MARCCSNRQRHIERRKECNGQGEPVFAPIDLTAHSGKAVGLSTHIVDIR